MFSKKRKKERSGPVEKLMNLASKARKNGEYKDALHYYDKALHQDNNDIGIWLEKGRLCLEIGKLSNAVNCFDQALSLDPECFDAVFLKARALDEKNESGEALKQYQRAIRLDATNAEAYLYQGYLLKRLNRYEDAIESLEQSLRYNPDHAGALFRMGKCHEELGRYKKSLALYDRSLDVEPKSYGTLMARGRSRALLSDHTGAVKDFRGAAETEGDKAEPYYHMAISLDLLKETDRALEALEEGLALAEEHSGDSALKAKFHFQLALCYEEKDLSLLAFRHASEARNSVPGDTRYSNYHDLLSREYHSDPGDRLTIELLKGLASDNIAKIRSSLGGLLERGDKRTIAPVIRTLYDGDVVIRTLLAIAEDQAGRKAAKAIRRKIGPLMLKFKMLNLNPADLKEKCEKELDKAIEKYSGESSRGDFEKRMGQALREIRSGMRSREKGLIDGVEGFLNLLLLKVEKETLTLATYLLAYSGLNFSLLLETDPDPNLIDAVRDPEHLKHTVFTKFRVNTGYFKLHMLEPFGKGKRVVIDETAEEIEGEMVRSVSREIKEDTWVTFGGGV